MEGRTFILPSSGLSAFGDTLLLKNTYTNFFSGSAQVQVPVKPVWPNVNAEAERQG
jgi:hypothetical protein